MIKGLNDNLTCSCCGSHDFDFYASMRQITITCNCCGRVTPLAFFDKDRMSYSIVGEKTSDLYEESYYRDITSSEARKAFYDDLK